MSGRRLAQIRATGIGVMLKRVRGSRDQFGRQVAGEGLLGLLL